MTKMAKRYFKKNRRINGKETKKLDEISKKFGDERQKTLDNAHKNDREKDFGKGSHYRLGERAGKGSSYEFWLFGFKMLLLALGLSQGRIIEIMVRSSGKTTVTLHAVAQAQKKVVSPSLIDAEHALDPSYAAALGVNIDELLLSQPDSGEQGLKLCD